MWRQGTVFLCYWKVWVPSIGGEMPTGSILCTSDAGLRSPQSAVTGSYVAHASAVCTVDRSMPWRYSEPNGEPGGIMPSHLRLCDLERSVWGCPIVHSSDPGVSLSTNQSTIEVPLRCHKSTRQS
jgi:hypothetical protein